VGVDDARRVIVIHNPIAGMRRRRRFDQTLRLLAERGCMVSVRATTRAGDAEAIAAAIAPGDCDAIAVAGGDGTINEVVNGLGAHSPPLGVIPLGTANVFAREIGLRFAPAQFAAAIAEATPLPLHFAVANGRRFVQMAGVGFDASVVAGVDPRVKRHLGKLAYVAEIARQWPRYAPARYVLDIAGTRLEASAVIIANGRYYGGAFVVDPDASPWQNRLGGCAFLRGGRIALLRYLVALGAGTISGRDDVRRLSGTGFAIDGAPGEAVQLDGDIRCTLPCRIEMGGFPLRVLASPQGSGARRR
jgi:diacylglycerol kinase (ATP)